MTHDHLELAQLQAAALFVHDAHGRLLRINEPDPGEPAPRFFLARTAAGHLWRTRADLPAGLAAALDRLATSEPGDHDLQDPPAHLAGYTALLQQHAPISRAEAGPAYYLPECLADGDSGADVVTITAANAHLLDAYYPWTRRLYADVAPAVVAVADGVAVALCHSARLTAPVVEAGVHTAAPYRGRGLAGATVRGWAAAVRAGGRQPLYSTSWANLASQAVACKLGAVPYAVTFSLT